MTAARWIGAGLLALCGLAATLDLSSFFAAWIVAWWFCLGILLGALANQWIHRLTGGEWGKALLPACRFVAQRSGWLMLLHLPLLVPVVFNIHVLYPWLRDSQWAADIARPAFKTIWLSPTFFTLRALAYLFIWHGLARLAIRPSERRGQAALALIVYGVVLTLAAVDGLASLLPQWYSSAFGLLVSMGQFFSGTAFGVWFACRGGDIPRMTPHESGVPPVSRDLGNLLLMYAMMWAYISFTQFQIIWAENLPLEISWYVPRLQTGWMWGGLILIVLHFFAPLILLLFRAVKDKPRRLAALAFAMLLVHLVDTMWLVLPSVVPRDVSAIVLAACATVGMGLLLWGDAAGAAKDARAKLEEQTSRKEQTMSEQGAPI